jgi:hypothetical protein
MPVRITCAHSTLGCISSAQAAPGTPFLFFSFVSLPLQIHLIIIRFRWDFFFTLVPTIDVF